MSKLLIIIINLSCVFKIFIEPWTKLWTERNRYGQFRYFEHCLEIVTHHLSNNYMFLKLNIFKKFIKKNSKWTLINFYNSYLNYNSYILCDPADKFWMLFISSVTCFWWRQKCMFISSYSLQSKCNRILYQEILSIDRNVSELVCVTLYTDSLSDVHKMFQVASTYDTNVEYKICNFRWNLFLSHVNSRQTNTQTKKYGDKNVIFGFKRPQNVSIL